MTIGVRAEARGHGVGTALLRALIELARDKGYPGLSLSVEEDNPALRLYERFGFVRVARVENAWTMRLNVDSTESDATVSDRELILRAAAALNGISRVRTSARSPEGWPRPDGSSPPPR